MTQTVCINGTLAHFWDFPAPTGPTITGVCRHCGATQTVPSLGRMIEDPRVRAKYRNELHAVSIGSRADHADMVERIRLAKAQAKSAIMW